MRTYFIPFLICTITSIFLFSCEREVEEFASEQVADYFPFQPGKYIIYRLDSTVFTLQGRAEETHSYQEKHEVDAQVTDNLGRTSYRIFRYIRDVAGTQSWRPNGSYFVTPLQNSVEVIESNQRIVKLISPVRVGTEWKGNRFLPENPYGSQFIFSNDDDMVNWNFRIDSTGGTYTFNNRTIDSVVTVTQINESLNFPITSAGSYAFRSFSIEKYAKNIGLVFQEFIMWEYQPNPGSSPYKVGFGVKRNLIEHNY